MKVNLWEATAPPPLTLGALEGDVRSEVAVIGAGVTGLSTALHLAESGRRVVVLEAGKLAGGATGRAGGQVLPGLKAGPDDLAKRFGSAQGSRLNEWSGRAPDFLFDIVERHRIECAAERHGAIQAAYTPRELHTLRNWSRQWRQRGADVRDLDRRELASVLGTPLYLGGILDVRGGSVHPLRYAMGLADAAVSCGAAIHVSTHVEKLQPLRGKWLVQAENGSVLCDQVVVATNAYSDDLVGRLAESIIPVPASQAATRPLAPEILDAILPARQVASDRRRMLVSFRITPCNRLMIGGPGGTGEATGVKLQDKAAETAAELFGHLGPFEWEFGWSGRVALTRDKVPHLHEPEPGLHVALGYSGEGLALGTALGKVVAERVNGRAASDLEVPLTPVRAIPFHGLAAPAIVAGERLISMLDTIERKAGRLTGSVGKSP